MCNNDGKQMFDDIIQICRKKRQEKWMDNFQWNYCIFMQMNTKRKKAHKHFLKVPCWNKESQWFDNMKEKIQSTLYHFAERSNLSLDFFLLFEHFQTKAKNGDDDDTYIQVTVHWKHDTYSYIARAYVCLCWHSMGIFIRMNFCLIILLYA